MVLAHGQLRDSQSIFTPYAGQPALTDRRAVATCGWRLGRDAPTQYARNERMHTVGLIASADRRHQCESGRRR